MWPTSAIAADPVTASLEPRTEAGRTLAGRDEWHRKLALAIEEQAATEARRELLAKVEFASLKAKRPKGDYGQGWNDAIGEVQRRLMANVADRADELDAERSTRRLIEESDRG